MWKKLDAYRSWIDTLKTENMLSGSEINYKFIFFTSPKYTTYIKNILATGVQQMKNKLIIEYGTLVSLILPASAAHLAYLVENYAGFYLQISYRSI